MIITDEKRDAIVAATRARIARWNASASKHGVDDRFCCDMLTNTEYVTLLTTHLSQPADLRAVSRELATGELRSAKTVVRKGRLVGFSIRKPDPKAWQKLADKPAEEIVRALKITGFTMFLGSRMVEKRQEI